MGVADFALTGVLFAFLAFLTWNFEQRPEGRLEQRPERLASGAAVVHDGDTLTIGGERMRLSGLDAPELMQECARGGARYACGREARNALARLVASTDLTCSGRGFDRYERLLVTCSAGGRNVNRALVEAGWAIATDDYHAAERAARGAERGIWAGTFEDPRDWRARHGHE